MAGPPTEKQPANRPPKKMQILNNPIVKTVLIVVVTLAALRMFSGTVAKIPFVGPLIAQ